MNSLQICEELLEQIPKQKRENIISNIRETNFPIKLNKQGTKIEAVGRQRNYYELLSTKTLMDIGENFNPNNLPQNWWDRISIAEKMKIIGIMEGHSNKEIIEAIVKRKELEIIQLEKLYLENGQKIE